MFTKVGIDGQFAAPRKHLTNLHVNKALFTRQLIQSWLPDPAAGNWLDTQDQI
jgi:hypothetical protein